MAAIRGKKSTFRMILISVLMLFWVLFFIGYAFDKPQGYDCLRANGQARTVLSENVNVQNLWNMKIRISYGPESSSYIAVDDDLLLLSDSACNKIAAFDLETGHSVWERGLAGNAVLVDPIRSHVVYFVEIYGSGTLLWAFNSQTGQRLWKNDTLNGQRIGLSVNIESGGEIQLYAGSWNTRQKLYYVNPNTGEFATEINLPSGTLLYHDGISLMQNEAALQAASIELGKDLWRWEEWQWSSNLMVRPIIKDNQVFVKNIGKLAALDLISGTELWRYSDDLIASNLAFYGEKIYFLTYSNSLVILDVETGNEITRLEFVEPTSKEHDSLADSYIAVEENVIAIYFQDTQTLSVMKIE